MQRTLKTSPWEARAHHTQAIRASNKFNFMECEEMATNQPKRCGNCMSCLKCSVRAQELTRKESEELIMIESNLVLDSEARKLSYRYPLIKDPAVVLSDNRQQAVGMAKGLERRLIKEGLYKAYCDELQDYINRGVIRLLTDKEIEEWDGAVNYVGHHPVYKPGSATTKTRIVSNSSLSNNHSGMSYNDCLVKGPNTLVPCLLVGKHSNYNRMLLAIRSNDFFTLTYRLFSPGLKKVSEHASSDRNRHS